MPTCEYLIYLDGEYQTTVYDRHGLQAWNLIAEIKGMNFNYKQRELHSTNKKYHDFRID